VLYFIKKIRIAKGKTSLHAIFIILCLSLFFPAQGIAQTPPTASREERLLLSDAKSLIQGGQVQEGIASLEFFYRTYPESPLAPDVLVETGKAYGQLSDLKKSAESFRLFLEKFPKHSQINTVRSQLSFTYLRMGGESDEAQKAGGVKEAMSLWKGVAGQETFKLPVYTRAAEIYIEQEEYANALHVLIQKKEILTVPADVEHVTGSIIAIIRNRLSRKELQTIAAEFSLRFPSDEAMMQLIKVYEKAGIFYLEEKEARRFLSLFPNHPYAPEVRRAMSVIQSKVKEKEYRIAVLLPLSGKIEPFGISALQGVQLALSQFEMVFPQSEVGLVIRDSAGSDTHSKGALEEWLNDYLPLGIIGPLLSKEVGTVAAAAERGRWALITPGATAANLPSMGRSVFRNATTPPSQCVAISEYAVSESGLKRFAILFPNESFGKEWVRCFRENVGQMGGKVVLAEGYAPHETDFKEPIERIKKAYGKILESEEMKKEGAGFDGIFLPGDTKTVGLILPQLVFYGLKNIPLFGTMGWNDPHFLKLAGQYAQGAVFVDGFFLDSPNPLIRKFVKEYYEAFQQDPNLFSAQAYDATNMILEAIKQGAVTPSSVMAAIAETKDFEGVSGTILEMTEGEAIKKPFLIQVQKGRLVQVN
jgi:ABC-type branched-subunit amino acid transport system substrate-binding protein